MFLEYKDLGRGDYSIIDSDFVETGKYKRNHFVVEIGKAIIDVYEKYNLDVIHNLVLTMIWLRVEHKLNFDWFMEANKLNNEKFSKYEKDLEKYLVLL